MYILLLGVAAVAQTAPPLPNCAATIKPGLGLGGGHGVRFVPVDTPDECCGNCTADLKCSSWTWDKIDGSKHGEIGPNLNRCTIRYAAGSPNTKNDPKVRERKKERV